MVLFSGRLILTFSFGFGGYGKHPGARKKQVAPRSAGTGRVGQSEGALIYPRDVR